MAKIYTPENMSSADVKKMQQALVDAGYSVGSSGVDGIWGKDTSAALKKYKADTGGSNTYGNTVGKETFDKLYGTSSSNKGTSSSNKGTSSGTKTPTATTTSPWTDTPNPNASVNAGGITVPGSNFTYSGTESGVEAAKQATNAYKDYIQNLEVLQQGYDDYITELEKGSYNANSALEDAHSNALAGIKQTYDDSARNYYRLYRTQEKELPEQLSSVGATGGATESAALRLMNNYSDNLYKNETARNKNINALNEDYYNAVANNSKQLASEIANAYLQLAQGQLGMQGELQNVNNSIYNNYLDNENANIAATYEQSTANDVARWNNNVTDRMAEQLAKGDTIWTWTDDDGKKHWSTYESVGLANGGKKLSPSKKKIDSSGGGEVDDVLPTGGYASPKLLTPSAAAGTPYAVAYEDIMSGFTSPNGTWISTSRNPLTRTFGAEAALKSYINSAKKK